MITLASADSFALSVGVVADGRDEADGNKAIEKGVAAGEGIKDERPGATR
jgi:hypothetical protein